MKKLLLWLTLPLIFVGCTAELESRMDGFEDRLSKLETLCSQLNTNISSLQTIVTALQNNDYVTSVTPIKKGSEEIGYTISFTKSKSITIYHGQDGADGKDGINGSNGKDGKDGQTPVIGVKKDYDGLYYWTLNGEWLLDASGKKIRAIGTDGKDGQNGADGKDGQNGTNGQDGKDGITPQLKIVDGYWQISYDNGRTWTQLGKATGENGNDGDSFFQNVSVTDKEVVMTLADGTVICLPKYSRLDIRFDFEGDGVEMMNGQTIEVGYTLINASEDALVTVSSDGTYKLKVVETTPTSGKIQITAGTTDNTGYVNVLVVDNGYTIGRVIDLTNFEVFFTLPSGDTYTVDHQGGNIAIPFETNLKREVSIYSGSSWLSVAPETKATVSGKINITAKANYGDSRTGKVKINTSLNGTLVQSYLVNIVQTKTDGTIDLSAEGTANSYIVSSSGLFKFKSVKGNSNESVGTVSSVEVLWETFGSRPAPAVGELVKDASYLSNGYIKFEATTPYKEGNALIAAKDESGKILWSWHIWLTDQPEEQVYYNNAGTMMDRNLGATTTTPGDVKALGLMYQWGRKDPFMGALENTYVNNILADRAKALTSVKSWETPVTSNATYGTIEYAISHPTTFILSAGANKDWYFTGTSSIDNSRWDSVKTIYDPCPIGWKVPEVGSNGIWTKALGTNNKLAHETDKINNGVNYGGIMGEAENIWYPICGYLSAYDGELSNIGIYVNYWGLVEGVNPSLYSYSSLRIERNNVTMPSSSYPLGYGNPVRCCKE